MDTLEGYQEQLKFLGQEEEEARRRLETRITSWRINQILSKSVEVSELDRIEITGGVARIAQNIESKGRNGQRIAESAQHIRIAEGTQEAIGRNQN